MVHNATTGWVLGGVIVLLRDPLVSFFDTDSSIDSSFILRHPGTLIVGENETSLTSIFGMVSLSSRLHNDGLVCKNGLVIKQSSLVLGSSLMNEKPLQENGLVY